MRQIPVLHHLEKLRLRLAALHLPEGKYARCQVEVAPLFWPGVAPADVLFGPPRLSRRSDGAGAVVAVLIMHHIKVSAHYDVFLIRSQK